MRLSSRSSTVPRCKGRQGLALLKSGSLAPAAWPAPTQPGHEGAPILAELITRFSGRSRPKRVDPEKDEDTDHKNGYQKTHPQLLPPHLARHKPAHRSEQSGRLTWNGPDSRYSLPQNLCNVLTECWQNPDNFMTYLTTLTDRRRNLQLIPSSAGQFLKHNPCWTGAWDKSPAFRGPWCAGRCLLPDRNCNLNRSGLRSES